MESVSTDTDSRAAICRSLAVLGWPGAVRQATLFAIGTRADRTGSTRYRGAARIIIGSALTMALNVAPAFANEGGSRHVHHSDSNLATLMERGMTGSETFRSLVAQLDAAPIQVLTKCDVSMPDTVSGRLNLVTSVQGVRYVQVAIRCTLSRRTVSFLAHELQHALEIANNPEIDDADSMESYMRTWGFRPTSLAAIAASRPMRPS